MGSQECSGKPDICCQLLEKIKKVDQELAQRRLEMLKDQHELFTKYPTIGARHRVYGSWEGHDIQMREKRINLEKLKKDFHRNKCDPPDGGLPEVERWPIPVAPDPKLASELEEQLKRIGYIGAGLGVGVLIIVGISRLIRLIPPLLPLQASPI